MSPTLPRRAVAVAATVGAALAAGPIAGSGAQEQEPAPKLEVEGAYLYLNELESGQKLVSAVFRTADPLPRRSDGAIRAGVSIDGVNHSIGTVRRGASIYTGGTEVKNGSVATLVDGEVVRKRAKLGRTFTVRVFTRDGQSVTRRLKLRAERAGDDTGRPLRSSRSSESTDRPIGTRTVVVPEAYVTVNPGYGFTGTVFRGDTIRVTRYSPSGKYAYGRIARIGRSAWIATSALGS